MALEELRPTCRIQSVESRHGIAVEHPEMAVVTRKQTWFTGGHNMIAHNVTTAGGGGGNNEETHVSILHWKVPTPLVSGYYLTVVCV